MNDKLIFTDDRELKVGTMYCIGQNYAEHAKEMGSVVSKSPVVFLKPPTAYLPEGESICIPNFSSNAHHEVELVVVIGKECRNISKNDALSYVAGYAVGIDVTLRDIQQKAKEKGHPWAVAKGFATSAPISKIVPSSEVSTPIFDLELSVNGTIRQQGSTSKMERSIETLIEYLSSVFILLPGDVIFTGTPEGVGHIVSGDEIHAGLKGFVELTVSVA